MIAIWIFLRVELKEFADGSDVGYEKKKSVEESSLTPRVLA